MYSVQFGAGNIGRGFMGQLFFEAGYEIVFVENNKKLVSELNREKRYTLRLLDAYSKKEIDMLIEGFQALETDQVEEIAAAFSEAELVGTAVGVKNLAAIAPLIAEGICLRSKKDRGPVDIYLCENSFGAAQDLQRAVVELLPAGLADWAQEFVGFVGTSVARMVPAPGSRFQDQDSLFVAADSYHQLPYDGKAARAEQPQIEGMKPVSNFRAEVERKLFTHNLGHAAMGYLGYLRGYAYIHESFQDAFLCSVFEGALDETTRALLKMYPEDLDRGEQEEIRRDVRLRFANPMIMDTVQRVARDPLRKLGPEDRLIGSAQLCLRQGLFPENIAFVCAAALCYDYPQDPDALRLQGMIRAKGIEQTLKNVSGVAAQSSLGRKILSSYRQLKKEIIP